MAGRLQGKVAIVTGGASGFGRSIAIKFAAEGAEVVVADLSLDGLPFANNGQNISSLQVDVTRRDQWERLLDQTLAIRGQIDIVVNNAGATYANKATELVTDEDVDLCLNVNIKSLYLSTSVLLPYFLENKRPGVFIQTASTAAIRPRPGLTWYNASKAAVVCATKTMAAEYGAKQIRFNCVSPVVGSTGM